MPMTNADRRQQNPIFKMHRAFGTLLLGVSLSCGACTGCSEEKPAPLTPPSVPGESPYKNIKGKTFGQGGSNSQQNKTSASESK
jgi:hypothetical protein